VVTLDFAGAPEAAGGEALRIAVAAAERAGASVHTLRVPEILAEAWRIQPVMQEFEAHQALAWEYTTQYEAMAPKLRSRLDESKGTHLLPMTMRWKSPTRRGKRWRRCTKRLTCS
jgi:hypothetical protein